MKPIILYSEYTLIIERYLQKISIVCYRSVSWKNTRRVKVTYKMSTNI